MRIEKVVWWSLPTHWMDRRCDSIEIETPPDGNKGPCHAARHTHPLIFISCESALSTQISMQPSIGTPK